MKRILSALGALILMLSLSGCARLNNPYDELTSSQLARLGSKQLCANFNDSRFKPSNNVKHELSKRGYKNCSESELYCQENLGLSPSSPLYYQCQIQHSAQVLLLRELNRLST